MHSDHKPPRDLRMVPNGIVRCCSLQRRPQHRIHKRMLNTDADLVELLLGWWLAGHPEGGHRRFARDARSSARCKGGRGGPRPGAAQGRGCPVKTNRTATRSRPRQRLPRPNQGTLQLTMQRSARRVRQWRWIRTRRSLRLRLQSLPRQRLQRWSGRARRNRLESERLARGAECGGSMLQPRKIGLAVNPQPL